jgi:hypothetical protein
MEKGKSQTHGSNRVWVQDPGGATVRHETGGSIPGGTVNQDGHSAKVTKGTV